MNEEAFRRQQAETMPSFMDPVYGAEYMHEIMHALIGSAVRTLEADVEKKQKKRPAQN